MNWPFMLRSTHLEITAERVVEHTRALKWSNSIHAYELNVEQAKLKAERETVAYLRAVATHLEHMLEDCLKGIHS